MVSSSKRARRRRLAQESLQKETSHSEHQMDPANLSGPDLDREEEEEDHEVLFPPRKQDIVIIPSSPGKVQAVPDCDMANMVGTLNGAIAAVSQDTARIQRAYQQLCTENIARDKALADLTAMVREYGSSPAATQPYGPSTPPDLVQRCRRMYWTLMEIYVPLTSGSHGRITKHSYMATGWSDQIFRGRQDRNQSMSTPYPRGGDGDRSSSSMTTQHHHRRLP